MGLITKEVEVGLSNKSKYYEGKGYHIPRTKGLNGRLRIPRGTKILVKVEDLSEGSGVFVDVQCDGCGEIINITWNNYRKYVKEDGKYYCKNCIPQERIDKRLKTMLDKSISFYQWCYDNLPKELADYILSRWDYELNIKNGKILTPNDVSYKSAGFSKKGYWFKCLKHPDEHKSEQKHICNFTIGQEGSLNCNQCNTLSITHPELIKKLVNPEDAFKYSMGSNEKIFIKCLDCGHIKSVTVSDFIRNNYHCDVCSDKLPYNEKFITCLLRQLLDDDFIIQLSKMNFNWCDKYRYDNYINKIDCVLETHGRQHYEEHKSNCWGTLEEIQENDFDKEWLARSNNIENYIILDCRESTMEWIKNSVMASKLPNLLGFKESNIDWLKCHEYGCSSLVKEVCNLWMSGIFDNVTKIMKETKLCRPTVLKYLKQGVKLGWCDYDPKNKDGQKVICITTGEVFNSISNASRKYNINISHISECCRHDKNKYAGNHPETGEKMTWMYYENYIIKSEDEIKDMISNINYELDTKIICLTTKEIFNTQNEAGKKYNIDDSSVSACCLNKIKTAGKHPETNEKLVWMFHNEYVLKTEAQLKEILNNNQKRIETNIEVICLTTSEIFNSLKEARIKYSGSTHISDCCKGKRKFSGRLSDGNELKWMYLDEYLKTLTN